MSHLLDNAYASLNQTGLPSIQAEMDPRRASSSSGSSFSFSGYSSVTCANSVGTFSSLLPQTVSYRPEQSRAIIDKNTERSLDMHVSRAGEGIRLPGKPVHQPIDSCLTRIQRECLSSETAMVSYPQPMSSNYASLGHGYPGVESISSSSDFNYERPTANEPSTLNSLPAASSLAGSGGSVIIVSSEREHVMQSLPGSGHFEYPLSDKPAAPTESSQHKYTSESASDTLLHFGLDEEDLDLLISYPEDHITPANLPFILRQIHSEKIKRAATAVQLKPFPEPQPARSVWGMDRHWVNPFGRMHQEEISPLVLEPSTVIDCGHTGKHTEGAGDETGSIGRKRKNCDGTESMLLIDTYASSGHIGEPPAKNTTEEKCNASGVSRDQASSDSSFSSVHSSTLSFVAAPSNDQTKQLKTKEIVYLEDRDIRVVKSEASKPVPLKQPEPDCQSTAKIQPPSFIRRCLMHPNRTSLVVIDSNDTRGNKNLSKNPGQGSTIAEEMKKQQMQQKQPLQQQMLIGTSGNVDQSKSKAQESTVAEEIKKQTPLLQIQQQQKQNEEKQPVPQTRPDTLPSVFSATESVPAASHFAVLTGAMQQLPFIPVGLSPIISPPVWPPQPIPELLDLIHPPLPTSNKQPLSKVSVSKDLPTASMTHDGVEASPKNLPHTCCLCNRKFLHMKDWVSHQNSSLHLENCKHLSKSAAGKDAKPSTSSQTSRYHQKTRHGSFSVSRSRSPIPRQHHCSESRREKPSSRSRYSRRSRSGSRPTSSRYWSRSKSPERRPSQRRKGKRSLPRRRDDRRSSPRRTDERRSPHRRSDQRRSPRRKGLSSEESVAEELLKHSAVHLLSNPSDLEALVNSLAPIILAKLNRMKSSSSSSSSSSTSSSSSSSNRGKSSSSSSSSPTAKKKWIEKPFKSSPSRQKSETSSSTSTKPGRPSAPTMVKLRGIRSSVSRGDVLAAVELFGKTKSFLLFPSKLEAIVCFEKEEDAEKLKSQKSLEVKGTQITVVGGKEIVSQQQKKSCQEINL